MKQVKKVSYMYKFLSSKSAFFGSLYDLIMDRGENIDNHVLVYMYELVLNLSDHVDEKQDSQFHEQRKMIQKIAKLDDTDSKHIDSLLDNI